MKKILSIFALIALLASCSNNKQPESVSTYSVTDDAVEMAIPRQEQASNEPSELNELPTTANKVEAQDVIDKKIIKEGRLGLKVKELDKTKFVIDSLVKKHNGYYANENFENSDSELTFHLKIRIPCANFEKFISEVESGDGEMLYKNIDAQDVTEQFVDLETRLENKKNYLARYNDLLKRANSIKEILEIEEEIRPLEEEIESVTGRLRYLSNLVAYSTLDLTISKEKDFKYSPTKQDNFFERLKQSLSAGWFIFISLLLFIIELWPIWIVAGVVIYFWKKHKRRKKEKIAKNN